MMNSQFVLPFDLSPFITISRLENFSRKDFSAKNEETTVTSQSEFCWRVLYVEKGTSIVSAGENRYFINHGEIAFFEPNSVYRAEALAGEDTRILQISFAVSGDSMLFFKEVIAPLNVFEHDNLYAALKSFLRFSRDSAQLFDNVVASDVSNVICSGQIIKNHLELMLLSLYQRRAEERHGYRIHSFAKDTREKQIVLQLKEYLQERISQTLSLETIAEENGYSVSQIQRIFKKETSISIIDYFINIKMELAKQLINEGNKTMSEIAVAVGYSNSNYFSRIFRKKVGTTPSDYGNL